MSASDERVQDADLERFIAEVYERQGRDYRGYDRNFVARNLAALLQKEQLPHLTALGERLAEDPAFRPRLWLALSRRSSAMFEDPTFYAVLRARVLPMLRTYPSVDIWVPGCSTGEAAYALAIVLREEGLYERSRIYATDVDEATLEKAKEGLIAMETVCGSAINYTKAGGRASFAEYHRAWADRAIVRPLLRERITFAQHDLASDGSINEFHLIVCEGVLSTFNGELRRRVFDLFHQSLCRFGVLGIGREDSLNQSRHRDGYMRLDGATNLYKRMT